MNHLYFEIFNKLKLKYVNHFFFKNDFLKSNNKFQFIIVVILSATISDKLINQISTNLFKIIKQPKDLYRYNKQYIFTLINKIWLYKRKYLTIIEITKLLLNKEKLTKKKLLIIHGIGNKTANLILSKWNNTNKYFIIDRHVKKFINFFFNIKGNNQHIENQLKQYFTDNCWLFSKLMRIHVIECKKNKTNFKLL